MIGGKTLAQIEVDLRHRASGDLLPIYIDVHDNSLSHKWLSALDHAVQNELHLEKNYCFLGFASGERQGQFILDQVNQSIQAINHADLGYQIQDSFGMEDCITQEPPPGRHSTRNIVHQRLNQLHRYFEDLQGSSGAMSCYYQRATAAVRWHIRQLNLLCHEFECWALSWRKHQEAPDWVRPSMLFCWLAAPRFVLTADDYQLFGVHTLSRDLGAVFVGVNKAVGKHHWEVFNDEGRDARIDELTTTALRPQTEAAADFDIEWGQNAAAYEWQQRRLADFEFWLQNNGFDPRDPALTIGHPQVGQVDLERSFSSTNHATIWSTLERYFDVAAIRCNGHTVQYNYHWSDTDFAQKQIEILQRN